MWIEMAICVKTRIHTLKNGCRTYLDFKRSSTGTASIINPPCFDKLDKVLSDKPTTLPKHLLSSSGV